MMRITFVLPPIDESGGMRVLATYAERLQHRGNDVAVVATSERRLAFRHRVMRVLRGEMPPPWKKSPRVTHFESLQSLRILPHPGPVTDADVPDADVVIATWWETAPMVAALSPAKGRKVYFLQGYEPSIPGVPTERAEATWRLPMQKIVVANWLSEIARDKFGDPTAICVPNSVDTKLFYAPVRDKQRIPTAGFIYVPGSIKGSDIAIDAILKAKQSISNLRVICFGTLPPGPALPLPHWFELTLRPAQNALRDLYASFDMFLQPSRIEGFGLPTLEAMACRTPVIATPAGAAPELLRGGGGKLVGHESSEQMAAAIVEMAGASSVQWRSWSDAAYRTATSFSWDDATEAFEMALRKAVLQNPNGPS